MTTEMAQVCRTCLEEVTREINYFELCGDERSAQIMNQFNLCIPELSFSLVKDPVICTTCASTLHLAYNFKQRCLSTESSIKNMLDSLMPSGQWTLNEIVRENNVWSRELSTLSEDERWRDDEEIDIDNKSSLRDVIHDMEHEVAVDVEKQEYILIKNEFTSLSEDSNEFPSLRDESFYNGSESTFDDPPELTPEIDPLELFNDRKYQPNIVLTRLPDYMSQSETVIIKEPEVVNPSTIVKWKEIIKEKVTPVEKSLPKKTQVLRNLIEAKKVYDCSNCKYVARSPEQLFSHLVTHTPSTPTNAPRKKSNNSMSNKSKKMTLTKTLTKLSSNSATHPKSASGATLYKCNLCNFSSEFRHCLKRHLLIHASEKVLKCHNCGFKTISRPALISHMKTHDASTSDTNVLDNIKKASSAVDEKPFACDICSYRGKSVVLLRKHKNQHLKRLFRQMNKSKGNKKKKSKKSLKGHRITGDTLRPKKSFKCETGDTVGPKKSKCETGETLGPKKTFNCETGDTVGPKKSKRETDATLGPNCETNDTAGTKKSKCETDDTLGPKKSKCETGDTLGPNCETSDIAGTKKSKCETGDTLGLNCETGDTVGPKKSFKCDYCKYKTQSQALIEAHKVVHSKTKERKKKSLYCKVCKYSTKSPYALKYHSLMHTTDTPFGCIVCEYTTFHQHNFVMHMRRHRIKSGNNSNKLIQYDFVQTTPNENDS